MRLLADAMPARRRARDRARRPGRRAVGAPRRRRAFSTPLAPEARGGAGLRLADAFPLFVSAGRPRAAGAARATRCWRALLAVGGVGAPEGPIAIAAHVRNAAPTAACRRPGHALRHRGASWVAWPRASGWCSCRRAAATGNPAACTAACAPTMRWPALPARRDLACPGAGRLGERAPPSRRRRSPARSQRVLQLTVPTPPSGVQFGQPSASSRRSSTSSRCWRSTSSRRTWRPRSASPATGRCPTRCRARAAPRRAPAKPRRRWRGIAHAVHGAIGITDEHDLQLYTRRLLAWRAEFGADALEPRRRPRPAGQRRTARARLRAPRSSPATRTSGHEPLPPVRARARSSP